LGKVRSILYNQYGKVVAKSEVIMDNLNPDFPPVTVDLESLGSSNNNSMGMSILIQFYDWEENGKHQSLGKIEATVQLHLS